MFDPETLSNEIARAYEELLESTRDAYLAQAKLGEEQEAHEADRDAIIFSHRDDPKAMGSNEVARETYLRLHTNETAERVKSAEELAAASRHVLQMKQLRVEHLRAQLRILEVAAGLSGSEARRG